jgi:hypothetical protein
MKIKPIIVFLSTVLAGCASSSLSSSDDEIITNAITDEADGLKFSIPLESNAYFYTDFECILDISEGKAKLMDDVLSSNCVMPEMLANKKGSSFQYSEVMKRLINSGKFKYVKVTRESVENYEYPVITLPTKYVVYKGDNSPFGDKECIFKVGDELEKVTTTEFVSECSMIDGGTYSFEKPKPDGLAAKIKMLKRSDYEYIVIKDGVIEEYTLEDGLSKISNYKPISVKEIDKFLKAGETLAGKYSLKVSLPNNSNSLGLALTINPNFQFSRTQLGREVYKGSNAFGVSKDIVKVTYAIHKLDLVKPSVLPSLPRKDEQHSICFDYRDLKLAGDTSGRAIHDLREKGDLTLYGHFIETRAYRDGSQPTIDYPYETVSKGKRARFQVEGASHNGVQLPLYSCS